MKAILHWVSALLLLTIALGVRAADNPLLATEEFMVPTGDSSISLYVRNKHPQGANKFPADKILLFVHGATYPSETTFDLRLNDPSWMD